MSVLNVDSKAIHQTARTKPIDLCFLKKFTIVIQLEDVPCGDTVLLLFLLFSKKLQRLDYNYRQQWKHLLLHEPT